MSLILAAIILYLKYCAFVWVLGLTLMLLGGVGYVLKGAWIIVKGYWWLITRSRGNK